MRPGAAKERELLRIGELARRAAVPVATIKHYLREGLLAPVQSGKNSALYDAADVGRVRRIKELQEKSFLPLRVIRDVLEGVPTLASVEQTIRGALTGLHSSSARTRASLTRSGVSALDLDWLRRVGAIVPVPEAPEESYAGDDLELLRVLGAARRAGLTADMLPLSIVADYIEAIRNLVRVELQLFETGVLPRAGENVGELTEQATKLSEKLVVLLRRRMIVPTLERRIEDGRRPLTPRPKSRK
jgi:DNA-binding transcriptional MerR regulator